MAATRRTERDKALLDEVRTRIQTTQLVNRLESHVLNDAEMSRTQITAAVALLKKTLPDLQATEMTGSLTISHEDRLKDLE